MAESSRHAQEDGNDSSSSASRKRRHSGQSEVPRKRLAARTPAIDEPRSRKIGDERKFGTVSFNGMTVTLPRAGPMFGSQPRYQDPHVSHARRQRSALERDDSRLSDQSRNMVDGESRARGSSIPVRGRRSNRLDNAESKDSLDVDQYSTHRDRRGRPVHSEQSSIRADPPDFLEKLVLNVVRHAELAHEEAKLQAMQCGRDDEARHIQCEKVRRRRRKQDQRLADLCWYAEIAELRDNLTLRRMGEDFFIRLSRMIRQYLELRKQHIAADEYYTCLRRLDDKQDGVLGAKIQNVIRMQHDDLDRLVRIDRQIGDAEHEMASVEPDFLGRERRLERLREVQRVQETELYKLAIPVLVSEGLVDRENVVVGLQLKTPQNSPPKATSPPRDKREQDTRQEPPISHLERSVVARDKPDELDKADGEQEPAEGVKESNAKGGQRQHSGQCSSGVQRYTRNSHKISERIREVSRNEPEAQGAVSRTLASRESHRVTLRLRSLSVPMHQRRYRQSQESREQVPICEG